MSGWIEGDYYYVGFAVEKSRRYHSKMQAFYEWCYNLTRAATTLTGTASFFVLLANGLGVAKYLTAVVALASSLDAVFRFNRKARIHEALARRFTDLSAKIATWAPVSQNLSRAKVERLKIERDEPPVRRIIDLQAHNEECRAQGTPETDLIPLSGWQRMMGYVFTPGMKRIEKWKADREATVGSASEARSA
ncbi:hypothetical protein SAMN05443247_08846 [Bradyrhizobium erythrophlei]|nr:hypothetical protein SAMN05443247_08846 [Bradyrhizobium erythrophlei]